MSKNRQYLPLDFRISDWASLEPYYKALLDFNIQTTADFEQFLKQLSELESMVSEDLAWRYIKMTCDTSNPELEQAYVDFVNLIQPNIAPYEDLLNKKINQCPFLKDLNQSADYRIYFRAIQNAIALYREENVPLQAELQTLSQKYGSITGAMSVVFNGETLTLQQAANFLVGGIFASVAVFTLFIVVLLAAPQGLFGSAVARRV